MMRAAWANLQWPRSPQLGALLRVRSCVETARWVSCAAWLLPRGKRAPCLHASWMTALLRGQTVPLIAFQRARSVVIEVHFGKEVCFLFDAPLGHV